MKMAGDMLSAKPSKDDSTTPSRNASAYSPMHTFALPKGTEKHYQQQFADMYFLRLAQLKKAVKQKAHEAWDDFELGGEVAQFVERVLDVRQGQLCWVVGTVYMELAMKPNVLDDISKEHWIAAPPPRETYVSSTGLDEMMLEDESGRLRATGESLNSHYVTGCVLAALGTEQADGTFQVIATQYADLPRQPERWEREEATLVQGNKPKVKRERAGKLAIVSGLEITGTDDDELSLNILLEYLTGEATGPPDQAEAAKITRLMIAGDSLSHASPILSREEFAAKKGRKTYGYDASAYNATPTERFDLFLSDLLPTLPITLIPGASDPANVALPQQPLHPALFPKARLYSSPPAASNETLAGLDTVTNPWSGDIEGYRVLATGGQTVADLLKYVDDVQPLEVMEMMLRWRCIAPTAPDTLSCYPFQDNDPLLLKECPHLYVVGCQDAFAQRRIEGPVGQSVLLISVPRFKRTGEIVLVDMETWGVEVVQIGVVEPCI